MAGPQFVGGTTQAVTGAKEFADALRRMAPEVKRAFDKQNRNIGTLVIERAQSKAAGFSKQAALASQSLKATASGGGVGIRIGGGAYPFALGAEFGSKEYQQFPPWTGNQWSGIPQSVGYWFHPAINEMVPEITDLYFQSVQAAAAASGLRVTPSRAGVLDIARAA